MQTRQQDISIFAAIGAKTKDYMILAKMRLNLIVVFSAMIGFLFAGGTFSAQFFWLFLGGFLITASSNTLNQIFEKDFDALMKRTQNRPLPAGRMNTVEAALFAGLTGIIGVLILWLIFNPMAALLGVLALISYAFIYTPLKRLSPIAVFVGAIPGALPPLIGWAAVTGSLAFEAWLLFGFQFLWQFPHFWAIAWVAYEDYKKAGYKLLPDGDKTRNMPIHSMVYIIALIGLVALPLSLDIISWPAAIVVVVAGILYFMPAFKLYKSGEDKHAKQLMYMSFLYLPVVLLAILLG